MADERTKLLKDIELGLDTQHFLGTNLGKYLQERAADQVTCSLEAFIDVDVTDLNSMRELQQNARLGRMFLSWLNESIIAGKNAEAVLMEMENTD